MFPDEPLKPGLWVVKPGSWNHSVEDGHPSVGITKRPAFAGFQQAEASVARVSGLGTVWILNFWACGQASAFFCHLLLWLLLVCSASAPAPAPASSSSLVPFLLFLQFFKCTYCILLLDDFVSFCSKHRAFTCHCRTLLDRRIGMPAEMQSQRLSGLLLS